MEDILIRVLQVVASLSLLIVTHEMGHMFFAKLFGTRVERFYMFFDPWFSLFKYYPNGPADGSKCKEGGWSFFKHTEVSTEEVEDGENANGEKITHKETKPSGLTLFTYCAKKSDTPKRGFVGDTILGIGWLPLGGYVSISGMIDESMNTEQMKEPVKDWEFRAKPAWQRLLIMLGGVLVNFLSALLIFWMIVWTWGESYLPLSEAKFGLEFHPALQEVGFQDGDIIKSIDGKAVNSYGDLAEAVLYSDSTRFDIIRNERDTFVIIPSEFYRTILEKEVTQMFSVRIPARVDSVLDAYGMGAKAGGMLAGDSIISVAGEPTPSIKVFLSQLAEHKDSTVQFVVGRGSEIDTLQVHIDGLGKIGIYFTQASRWMTLSTRDYSFFEACPAGISKGVDLLVSYVKQMKLIFTKEGAKKLGGFGTIGQMFPTSWNWQTFWFNTAFLAIILAVMNVLPIPALDGGHVLFLLFEIITRRKPSDKFLTYAQMTGMILLLALLVYANANDIIRAFLN
ncbi:MAG: RIP metalloprotease RseP [Marinilabiliaceae bacterium]|nr:RIP metalloprotease RseP [Marinilabiliaceae bacterium]